MAAAAPVAPLGAFDFSQLIGKTFLIENQGGVAGGQFLAARGTTLSNGQKVITWSYEGQGEQWKWKIEAAPTAGHYYLTNLLGADTHALSVNNQTLEVVMWAKVAGGRATNQYVELIPAQNGGYLIKVESNGKYLSVDAHKNDATIVPTDLSDSPLLRWNFIPLDVPHLALNRLVGKPFMIQSQNADGGQFLAARGGALTNGQKVVTWTYGLEDQWKWKLEAAPTAGHYYLTNLLGADTHALSVNNQTLDVVMWAKVAGSGATNQYVEIAPAKNGGYTIKFQSNGKYLSVPESKNDAKLVPADLIDSPAFRWNIVPLDNALRIATALENKPLFIESKIAGAGAPQCLYTQYVAGTALTTGQHIATWSKSDQATLKWKLVPALPGLFHIVSVLGDSHCIDSPKSFADDAAVALGPKAQALTNMFRVVDAGQGWFYLSVAYSNKVLYVPGAAHVDGAAVALHDPLAQDNFKWRFVA